MHAHDVGAADIPAAERTMAITAAHEKAHRQAGIAALLLGIAALVFAVAILLAVLWLMLGGTTAAPFDADGVRCYGKALQLTCIKTANP